jgi:phosphopantothenoylcysteine decarboxylase
MIPSNVQTSLLRALSPTTPTYVFPAMNTLMYEHPLTSEHIRVVRDVVRYEIVGPIGKALACGDVGTCFHRPSISCVMPLFVTILGV